MGLGGTERRNRLSLAFRIVPECSFYAGFPIYAALVKIGFQCLVIHQVTAFHVDDLILFQFTFEAEPRLKSNGREKYEIEKENNLIKKKINELKNNLEFLNKLKKVKNIYLEEKNKININKEIIEEYNKKINNLEIEKEKINNSKNKINYKKIKINKYIFYGIIFINYFYFN